MRRRRGKGTKEALAARSATFKANADGSDCSRAAFGDDVFGYARQNSRRRGRFPFIFRRRGRTAGAGEDLGWGVLRRYIRLCVRINLRITGKARLGRIIPGIRVCDLSVERTRAFFIQRNAPWSNKPRGVKGDAMNRKRDSITRSGSDLLFRVLRQSTIGVSGFHFRVRNGIECFS